MNFLNTLKVLNYHPLTRKRKIITLFKYLKYRIIFKFLGHPLLFSPPSFRNTVTFIIKDVEQYQIIYTDGLPEFYELSFLLHFIRPADTFIDIGANRGLFSLIASGYGKAHSIAFEPIPGTFQDLQETVRLNDLDRSITLINAGVAAQTSIASFSTNHGTANHIVKNGDESVENTVAIKVYRLDEIVSDISTPALMKIDVEGLEYEVLSGAASVLQNQQVKCIIIELNGAAEKYNYKEEDIHQLLVSSGFKPYRYYPLKRELSLQSSYRSYIPKKYMSDNTIYIRDIDFVNSRLREASKINIRDNHF